MEDLIVKPVDVLGSSIMAAQDKEGSVFAGVSYFCNALGMTRGQKNRQVKNVQKDETLKRGCIKLGAGVLDEGNEAVALRIDFIPIWLAKISITDKTKQENPELADKLLEYQLKAKDILAAAFMPQQETLPLTLKERVQTIAKGTAELYEKVERVDSKVDALDKKFQDELMNLPILGVEENKIEKATRQRGTEVLGGKQSNAYNDKSLRGKLYWDLHIQLRREFGVSTYKAIKRNQTDLALKFLAEYRPPLYLQEQIEQANAQQSPDFEEGGAV